MKPNKVSTPQFLSWVPAVYPHTPPLQHKAIRACEVTHFSKNKNVRGERASSLTDCSVNAHFIENYKKVLNVSVPLIQCIKRLLSRLVF